MSETYLSTEDDDEPEICEFVSRDTLTTDGLTGLGA